MTDTQNWQKRATTFRQVKYGSPSLGWTSGLQHRLNITKPHANFKNKKILDIGCGVGMFLKQFRKLGASVYGVDVDKEKINIAKKKYKDVKVAPAEKLPFAKQTFDIIWIHEVVEHVRDDKKVIREAFRVLKPGGKMIMFAPNRLWPFETHGIFWHDKYRYGNIPFVTYLPNFVYKEMTPHVKNYFKAELFRLFESLDHKVVTYRGIFPGLSKIRVRFPIIGSIFLWIFRIVEKTPFHIFGLSHFVILEKKL